MNSILTSTTALLCGAVGWMSTEVVALKSAGRPTQEAAAQEEGPVSMSLIRSVELPTAKVLADGEAPEFQGMDTYVDWDLGNAIYVHANGSMSTTQIPKNWVFRTTANERFGLYSIAVQRTTGISFVLEDAEWTPINESGEDPLMIGDFDVSFEVDEETVYAMRFDRYSGRSWLLQDASWMPIPGALADWPVPSEDGDSEGER